MKNKNLEQVISKMREYIRKDVAAGFASGDEICNSVVEIFSDEQDSSVLLAHAKNIVQENLEAHIKEQATWEEITDCDRLDQAFENLESNGIISRQNYSCCSTCGTGKMLDEMKTAKRNGKNVRGYTYYHAQDTESAVVDGDGLYLNYGSIEDDDTAYLNIGYDVVRVINQHNLTTVWNGDLRERIFVKLDWKRRR